MKDFILMFDIPKELNRVEVRVWRDLNKINAEKIQHSLWKSNKLKELIDIATFIKNSGGTARILEEKLIFA